MQILIPRVSFSSIFRQLKLTIMGRIVMEYTLRCAAWFWRDWNKSIQRNLGLETRRHLFSYPQIINLSNHDMTEQRIMRSEIPTWLPLLEWLRSTWLTGKSLNSLPDSPALVISVLATWCLTSTWSLKCGVLTDLDLSILQWEPRIIGTDRAPSHLWRLISSQTLTGEDW